MLVAGVATVRSQAPKPADDPAREILREYDRWHHPDTQEMLCEVTVTAASGKQRSRTWRMFRRRTGTGSSDVLIRFLAPPELRGVGYLSLHRDDGPPDQWLYLPSMKRERRIDARDRDAAFVGTSFSYEDLDLLDFDESRFEVRTVVPRAGDGPDVTRVVLTPRGPSAYASRVLTFRKADAALLAVEYFASGVATPIKRLTLSGEITGAGFRTPTRIEMVDVRKGVRTTLELSDVAINRRQPPDRFTLHNLLREDEDQAPVAPGRPLALLRPDAGGRGRRRPEGPPRMPAGFTGYVETRAFGFFGPAATRVASTWATLMVRQTARLGPVRVAGAVRFETSSSSQVGPLAFDPADRDPRRAPISLRELTMTLPIHPGVDVRVGRFEQAWGETDGYSPADAFLPRDLSEPLTEERLPLWAASLRGELRGVRFDVLAVPTTTPWRLPELGGERSPLASVDVRFVERPWRVPRAGFEGARVMGSAHGWDLSGWVRSGVRPVPVLESGRGRRRRLRASDRRATRPALCHGTWSRRLRRAPLRGLDDANRAGGPALIGPGPPACGHLVAWRLQARARRVGDRHGGRQRHRTTWQSAPALRSRPAAVRDPGRPAVRVVGELGCRLAGHISHRGWRADGRGHDGSDRRRRADRRSGPAARRGVESGHGIFRRATRAHRPAVELVTRSLSWRLGAGALLVGFAAACVVVRSGGADRDSDGLDDDLEATLAARFLPALHEDVHDPCDEPSRRPVLYRVRPRPGARADVPVDVAITYVLLYAEDCGPLGHAGDVEAFTVFLRRDTPAAEWHRVAAVATAHRHTPAEQRSVGPGDQSGSAAGSMRTSRHLPRAATTRSPRRSVPSPVPPLRAWHSQMSASRGPL